MKRFKKLTQGGSTALFVAMLFLVGLLLGWFLHSVHAELQAKKMLEEQFFRSLLKIHALYSQDTQLVAEFSPDRFDEFSEYFKEQTGAVPGRAPARLKLNYVGSRVVAVEGYVAALLTYETPNGDRVSYVMTKKIIDTKPHIVSLDIDKTPVSVWGKGEQIYAVLGYRAQADTDFNDWAALNE